MLIINNYNLIDFIYNLVLLFIKISLVFCYLYQTNSEYCVFLLMFDFIILIDFYVFNNYHNIIT